MLLLHIFPAEMLINSGRVDNPFPTATAIAYVMGIVVLRSSSVSRTRLTDSIANSIKTSNWAVLVGWVLLRLQSKCGFHFGLIAWVGKISLAGNIATKRRRNLLC
jgi:ABC-type antimicrobial peptide transport system permease subunit